MIFNVAGGEKKDESEGKTFPEVNIFEMVMIFIFDRAFIIRQNSKVKMPIFKIRGPNPRLHLATLYQPTGAKQPSVKPALRDLSS